MTDGMEFGFFIAGAIILAIVVRLIAGSIDTGRIERYVRQRGWKLEDKSWDPLGPGWFGEKNDRIYQIVYRDKSGDLRRAHVKTSMFSGVYLTNEEVIEKAKKPPVELERKSLQDENERLKARVTELEKSLGNRDRK